MNWYRWNNGDLLLTLSISPKATKDAFVAPYGDAYKVNITAPPVDGRANEHLLRFLAKSFGVKISDVTILLGTSNRRKVIRVAAPGVLPNFILPPVITEHSTNCYSPSSRQRFSKR